MENMVYLVKDNFDVANRKIGDTVFMAEEGTEGKLTTKVNCGGAIYFSILRKEDNLITPELYHASVLEIKKLEGTENFFSMHTTRKCGSIEFK